MSDNFNELKRAFDEECHAINRAREYEQGHYPYYTESYIIAWLLRDLTIDRVVGVSTDIIKVTERNRRRAEIDSQLLPPKS